MTVRIAGRYPWEALAFVTLPGARSEVRVRVGFYDSPAAWRCDACGRFPNPRCPHAVAVQEELSKGDCK